MSPPNAVSGIIAADLTLPTTGIAPGDHDGMLPGWLNVLPPLKAAVDFGIDLRNHDAARSWGQGFVNG
ncbi:hypothetical protein KCG44_03970 [Pacificimonas sp. WHA3]|uniref:Uncharacterized protein n=1 Tax=Pacificimonas pallii TaxID=2827236 RepID=A0ABS6SBY4_9SPHN|nr:hypothetical protein [Pacificimonas pallii]MBV7255937.1 hypothetical protein [Pacificimonas pallii]